MQTLLIHRVVRENIGLLSKAFKNQFVIPEFGPFCKQVSDTRLTKARIVMATLL